MSDAGDILVSEKLKEFCQNLNIEQAVSSSDHPQGNRQVEVYIKLIQQTLKKYFNTNTCTYLALLHVRFQPTWARTTNYCNTIV